MNETNKAILAKLQQRIHIEESHGCRLSYASIDPQMATELLSLSQGNRPLSKATVNKYRRHMERGTWDEEVPSQFILFDEDGVLIDGHHRLTALRQSGKTVRLYFMFNVKKSQYIDAGRRRTEADRIAMTMNDRSEKASYQRAVAMCNVISECTDVEMVTEAERFAFIKLFKYDFQWATEALSMTKAKLSTAPIRTAFLLAKMAGASGAKLEHFWEVLVSGYSKCPEDRIIIRLRDYLKEKGDSRSRQYRRTVLNTVSYVLGKWLEGDARAKVEDKDDLKIWKPAKRADDDQISINMQ